ncbi:MAG: winged helix-turn-helix domain-containing protein, partial [Nanoarchaeota archaeon]|nr:winged helix-turn-helix domain-containing protein [Nanoarchaeota archaeon]
MSGRTKQIRNIETAFTSENRGKILVLCEIPKNFNELKKEVGLSVGALTYHLNFLLEVGLLTKTKDQNDDRKIIIQTNSKKIQEYQTLLKKKAERNEKQWIKQIDNKLAYKERELTPEIIELLVYIQQNQNVTDEQINNHPEFNTKHKIGASFLVREKGYAGLSITPKGEQYLK